MTFSLSGSTITQTGTDADSTGIVTIAGVNGSTGNRQIDAGGLLLAVGGNLTIRESFLVNRIRVNPTGSLTLGAIDINGVVEPCSIYIQVTGGFGYGGVGVEIDNGGSLNLNNSFVFFDNLNADVAHFGAANRDGWVFNALNSEIITSSRAWHYLGGGGDIDGLTIRNTNAVFFQGSPNTTNNITLIDTVFGFGIDNQVGITVDLSKSSTPLSIIQRANNNFNLIDVQLTTGLTSRGFQAANAGWNFLKTLTTRAVGENAGTSTTKYIFASDNTELFSGSLDANGFSSTVVQWGRILTISIANGAVVASNTINSNTGNIHAVGEYKLPLKVAYVSYNGALAVQEGIDFDISDVSYIQDFGLAPNLVDDSLITETNKAVTDAYTELDTSAKFYDYAKSFLVDNYQGETETIVTRSMDTIDVGSYDVVFASGGSNVFEFDGTTITVRCGTTFTGNITTTGTVTTTGSASVNGTIIDSTADSALMFSGIDSWIVYANATDQDTNTNALASGSGAENYRFVFVDGTTYYLRLSVGTDTILKTVTPTEAGETSVELTTAGLLTALPANVDAAVTNSVDGIDLPATISSGVEAAILDDSDGQAVITAIVSAIGSSNIDEVALVAAIRTDLERSGGSINNILSDTDELQLNQGDWATADVSGLATAAALATVDGNVDLILADTATNIPNQISGLNDIAASDVVTSMQAVADDFKADISGLATAASINALNNISAGDLRTELSTELGRIDATISSRLADADYTTPPTTAEIEGALLNEGDGQQLIDAIVQAIGNVDIDEVLLVAAIRADLERTGGMLDSVPTLSEIEASTILAKTSDIAGLNNITAAEVWAVATRTVTGGTIDTNLDMRGTDGANTIAPDNASITAILADTSELQANQGNWLTATGFATPLNVSSAQTAIQWDISALNNFNPATDTVARVTLVDTVTTNTDMRGTDGANTVTPDNPGISTIQTNLTTINNGVKKASLFIPHADDL